MKPSPAKPNAWWNRASTEERLKQIDAGIELRMTARQIAMNLRVSPYDANPKQSPIDSFAKYHGRRFRGDLPNVARRARVENGKASLVKRAPWLERAGTDVHGAFSIFEAEAPQPMFDELEGA
ncbi:hypothetical protein [Pararhizobium sp.]|uniref:hypothetical protein n=1 Tax=Pararhizobium sp. TaxID=1977563 RepID=UPI0027238C27|nr:hypothetical protein [Pararhizobium sp.]MDO9417000.1 hypothetical protein [Pararhizobium sp.]